VPVRGDGASTRVFALESTIGYDAAAGPVQSTGRPLDVALQGNGPGWPCRRWTAPRPTRAPARCRSTPRASCHARACRCWATAVRSTLPAGAAVEIAGDGTVTTTVGERRAAGRPPEAGDARGGAGARHRRPVPRRRRATCRPTPRRGCSSGALEGSNVSPVQTMVAMIAAARQFEQQMKMLQGAEQREQAAPPSCCPRG
jgi:flagellar basal-body rod protein FlgF